MHKLKACENKTKKMNQKNMYYFQLGLNNKDDVIGMHKPIIISKLESTKKNKK